jgi:hypothetical protein
MEPPPPLTPPRPVPKVGVVFVAARAELILLHVVVGYLNRATPSGRPPCLAAGALRPLPYAGWQRSTRSQRRRAPRPSGAPWPRGRSGTPSVRRHGGPAQRTPWAWWARASVTLSPKSAATRFPQMMVP